MELVSKIFDTLEISQLALLQLGLVVVLAFLLSTLLIRPILRTFEERENLSVKPVEESRRILFEADEKARGYDEALRKGAAEALARKRRVMEETSRAGRRQVEAVSRGDEPEGRGTEGPDLRREGISRRVPARPGVAALHGDRPESPREAGRVSRPRTHARRVLRVVAPLAALLCAAAAFAAEESGAHPAGGVHIPWGEILKQAINFLILAGVLVYFLRKPVSSFLKERSELLRKAIDDAAKARAEAAEKLAAIETRTAKLADEIAGMNAKMDVEAAAEARRLQETAAVEISRIRAQSEFTGEQEVKKAREELRQEASLLTARAAEEIVRKTLSPEDQERLVRENLEKIEGIVH